MEICKNCDKGVMISIPHKSYLFTLYYFECESCGYNEYREFKTNRIIHTNEVQTYLEKLKR